MDMNLMLDFFFSLCFEDEGPERWNFLPKATEPINAQAKINTPSAITSTESSFIAGCCRTLFFLI